MCQARNGDFFLFSLFLILFWNRSSESDAKKKKKSICSETENLKKKQREERLQLVGKAGVARLKSGCEQQFIYRNPSLGVGEAVSIDYSRLNSQPK